MTLDVDFTNQAFFRDPTVTIERLRSAGPLVETRFPIVGRVWITTTYQAAAEVMKDSRTFTMRSDGGALAGLWWWMPALLKSVANNMLTMDEPITHGSAESSTKHSAAAPFSTWSRAFAPSPTT